MYDYLKERGVVSGKLPDVSFKTAPAYRSDLKSQVLGITETEDMLLRDIVSPNAVRATSGEMWNNYD